VRNRIFFKLFAALLLVILAGGISLDIFISRVWEASLQNEIQRNLHQKALMFASRLSVDKEHNLQQIAAEEAHAAGARATIIDASGRVLADSEAEPASMQNHSRRPEFAAALNGKVGDDSRRSQTLGIRFLYVAVPIPAGAVRLAYPLSDVESTIEKSRKALLTGLGVAFLIALAVSVIASQMIAVRLRRIVEFADQIAAGDLTARISARSGDEIGQLAAALDKTARHLERNFVALQTSQYQLETLLNSMEDAVIAIGRDARVQWANDKMDRLVPQHTRLGAPVVETVRDPDFLRAIRGANESRKVLTARATSIVQGRIFDVTAAPMPEGGAVAVLRDLTKTARMEKTRRDFIANVSHELRTPLTSIQGYAETLLDSAENQHNREFLEVIRKNASRMSRLTEDLLTLARVESGEQRFEAEPVTPKELLKDAVQNFREQARNYGIELQVENSSENLVSADREAIHQVFANLIDNALKYAASGGRLVLGARDVENAVEFYVRDFGQGIASEHLPRLFERFYRVDKARSRESGGTGLGLAIAKHIVLAHGGAIRAESELNHGSVFVFSLPLAKDQPGPYSIETAEELTEL